MFGHSDVPLFVSAKPVLHGILLRLFPAPAQTRDLFVHRVLLHVLHILLIAPSKSRQDWAKRSFCEAKDLGVRCWSSVLDVFERALGRLL